MGRAVTVQPETVADEDALAPDDLDAYVATFDDGERQELAEASAALDLAILLHRARERRGLTQRAAAELAGLRQQAVSRFERPDVTPRLESVRSYLHALGYRLELTAIDAATGEVAATVQLPPRSSGRARAGTP